MLLFNLLNLGQILKIFWSDVINFLNRYWWYICQQFNLRIHWIFNLWFINLGLLSKFGFILGVLLKINLSLRLIVFWLVIILKLSALLWEIICTVQWFHDDLLGLLFIWLLPIRIDYAFTACSLFALFKIKISFDVHNVIV